MEFSSLRMRIVTIGDASVDHQGDLTEPIAYRTWHVTADRAQSVADLLGEPTDVALVSEETAAAYDALVGGMAPRWFAQDFVNLYERVKDADSDIVEEYGKWAQNARLWLEETR